MRLAMLTSCVIAYSCYVSCIDQSEEEDFPVYADEMYETKMFSFLIREYAQMLNQGTNSEIVHDKIKEVYKEKPEFADKLWDKVVAAAKQSSLEAVYAFGEKK